MFVKLSDTDKRVAEINAGAATNLAVTNQKIAELEPRTVRWACGAAGATALAIVMAILRFGR